MFEEVNLPDDEGDRIDFGASDEYVTAIYVETPDEAEQYVQLLADHDIDAMIGSEEDEDLPPSMSEGVAVLVPADQLDEAAEVIADHEESGGFVLEAEELEEQEDEYDETEDMEELDVDEDDDLLPLDLGGDDDEDEDADDEYLDDDEEDDQP